LCIRSKHLLLSMASRCAPHECWPSADCPKKRVRHWNIAKSDCPQNVLESTQKIRDLEYGWVDVWVPWPLPLNTPSPSSAFLPARSPTSLEGHQQQRRPTTTGAPATTTKRQQQTTTAMHNMKNTSAHHTQVSLERRRQYNFPLRERDSPHPVRRVAPSLLAVSENLPPTKGARARKSFPGENPEMKSQQGRILTTAEYLTGNTQRMRGLWSLRHRLGHYDVFLGRGSR